MAGAPRTADLLDRWGIVAVDGGAAAGIVPADGAAAGTDMDAGACLRVLVSALDRQSLATLLDRMQELLFAKHGDVVPQLFEPEIEADPDDDDGAYAHT